MAGTIAYTIFVYRPFEKRWAAKTKSFLAQSHYGRARSIAADRLRLVRLPGFD
jgi:hypothetical protein